MCATCWKNKGSGWALLSCRLLSCLPCLSLSLYSKFVDMTINILLFFSVTPFKIDQNKNQNRLINSLRPESGYIKGGEYTKTPAKNRVRGIFRIRDIWRNVLPRFIGIYIKTPCWWLPGGASTWRTETSGNICYRVLLQKCEFIPRGTHKHRSNTFSNTLSV